MDPKTQQAIAYFNGSSKFNPNDPTALNKLRDMFTKAKNLKASPNYGRYPVELRTAIEDAYQNLSALPQLTGIKTQVSANKWDSRCPPLPPLGKRSKW